MKAVSAYPNYINNNHGKVIKSWSAVYKIEIPAFDNPITKQTQYVSILNAGIEITASANGQVISLKYNLLPLKGRKRTPLFKIISDESDIPQLSYLLNKETNIVAPFYLTTSEEGYIPATKDSILPKQKNNEVGFHNPTDFNKERIVVWLKRVGLKKRLKLKDASSSSDSDNNVQVPVGAKLIRLKPIIESSKETPCIYWWNNSYHQSLVPEANLGSNNVVLSNFSGQVLQNDIEHLLHRITSSTGKNKQFDEVIKFVASKKNILLDKQKMIDAITIYNRSLFVDTNNKPETIKRFSKLIEVVYNPVGSNNNKWFDELLILPLSEDWFNKDEKLKARYDNVWKNSGYLNNLVGGSGSYSFTQEELSTIKDELLYLKSFIEETSQKMSPEAVWLNTITQQSLNLIKRIIFISNATWYYNKFQKYAEGIGVNISFSIFSAPPLLSVILHEFSQGDSFYYKDVISDPHITIEDTEHVWKKISSQPNNFELLNNQEFTNRLYQCDAANSLINLAILLTILEKL